MKKDESLLKIIVPRMIVLFCCVAVQTYMAYNQCLVFTIAVGLCGISVVIETDRRLSVFYKKNKKED